MDQGLERTQMAWHIFIQWLAHKNILDMWLNEMLIKEELGDPGDPLNFYNKYVGGRFMEETCYEFIRWAPSSPLRKCTTKRQRKVWLQYLNEWRPISHYLKDYLRHIPAEELR